MQSIYQAYVDAVQGAAKAQQAKQELQLNQVKIGLESLSLAQQLQERELTAQVMAQYQGQGGQQGTQGTQGAPGGQVSNPQSGPYSIAGGSTPNANPTSGDDPSLKQAAMYDTMSAKLMQAGLAAPAAKWADEANKIRTSYYTQAKDKLQLAKTQNELVANIYGSVNDQQSYTQALIKLQNEGVDITKFGLSGTYSTDADILKSLADQSMTRAQKIAAAHSAATLQVSQQTLGEKIRHDHADEAKADARIGLETARNANEASWKKYDMDYKARAEARAQAGVNEKGEQALAKDKKYAQTPNPKVDGPYIDAVIAADPKLSALNDKQKAMVKAEINLTARNQLAAGVTKPGDIPSWDDFMAAADKAAKGVSGRVTKESHIFGKDTATIGARPPSNAQPKSGGPLPPPINSMADLVPKTVGDQVTIGGKQYKITKKGSKPDGSDTELAEIK